MNGSGITFIQKEQEVLINSSSQNQVLENNISKSIPLVELNSDHSSCSECPLENKVIDGNSYKLQKCDQPSMSNISENESNEIDLGTKDFLSGKGSLESLIEMMTDQATCINGSKLFTDGVPEEYGKYVAFGISFWLIFKEKSLGIKSNFMLHLIMIIFLQKNQ